MRRLGPIALLVLFAVCALPANAQQKENDALAKLQAAQAASPGSVAANRALGVIAVSLSMNQAARISADLLRKSSLWHSTPEAASADACAKH